MDNKKQLMALALCGLVGMAQAGEKEELLKLRNTTTNLIKELVKQGVLTEKVAEEMIKKAEADAETQAKEQTASKEDVPAEPGEVRVPYVPEFVKDEIRQQVRSELRADVVKDVMQEAKTQKWGVPDALPEWINRFKLSGDLRLRSQSDFMSSNNDASIRDFLSINQAGGESAAGARALLNTQRDRQRFRERLRLSIDAKVADNLKAGVRLATGNIPDPVSTNQSLGNNGNQYQFNVDRAFLKYDAINDDGFAWLMVEGGRMANPFYVGGGEFTGGSEMVWDTDLSFEGIAATIRHQILNSGELADKSAKARTVYATVGAFPLQESEFSSRNQWFFGSQVGLDWGFQNQDSFRLGVAYYDYQNTQAKPNTKNSNTCDTNTFENTLSALQWWQFGNTVARICNEVNSATTFGLVGLASDYNIINANASYDFAKFAPHHVILSVDYAKNVGFDNQEVQAIAIDTVTDQTDAWQVRVDFGWPKVDRFGQWNVFTLYKYVESDAVFAGFADSDFHLGGSNAKGWVIGGNYGLMKNVWATGRWLSTDVVSGPTYSNDILQLDVNTRF